MAGYYGWSMSNNAVEAYESGEKPFSKWTKKAIFEEISENAEDYSFNTEILAKLEKTPVKVLKKLVLYKSSWHHTSSYYNSTDFYSVDFDKIEELTKEEIEEAIFSSKEKEKEKIKKEDIPEKWECRFLEWSGSRHHPKATEIVEIGEIKGNWFFRSNGSKKSVNANGFEKIRKIEE